MHSGIFRAIGIAVTVAIVSFSQSALAAEGEIVFANNMETGVKALFCAEIQDAGQQIAGPVDARSSVKINAAKLPAEDFSCSRIYALMDDGSGWQFHTSGFGPAGQATLNWDNVSVYSEAHYPSLLIEFGDDVSVYPAGLPLVAVKQMLQFGMQEDDWKSLATPGYDTLANPGKYCVSFASVSWSLTNKGITYFDKPIGNNLRVAEQVELTAPYSIPILMAAFDEIREFEGRPLLFSSINTSFAFSEEGKKLDPTATLLESLDADDDAPWDALHDQIRKAAADGNSKALHMVFGSDDVRFELELNLDTSQAFLRLIRDPDAPFG